MYVIRLPDGTLRVPRSATTDDGRIIGQGYVEIGPDDPDYERLLGESLTEEELADRRRQWREGDEALLREFEEYKASRTEEH
ncbi:MULTISPECIES: hypothetical protein [Thermomonospora]|uniref:Uncharacterized protein n=1 Tax=Thermomonospora cellulosilytica TaxID=1411118 RepID=A0A7W3MT57_9ACTN|nr:MULTISPECIES: hypothetical protein [Thermomonospora]MBA9001422.1 hypothetical protein [Thermomonospora cellulosilytica]